MENATNAGNEEFSSMYSLEARIRSFRTTSIVDGKKFRWRYTVIPYQGMARLGFFYHPFKNLSRDGEIHRDAIRCICCKRITYDFGDCRSKKKDIVETMISVLRQHLHGNECILSELKLKVLQDHLNDFTEEEWGTHPTFSEPLSEKMLDLRRCTFLMNWNALSESLLPERMSQAGLLRYDSSYTGFEELIESDAQDACYCIYCKRIVGSWQKDDNPLLEHYRSSNGGNCYFFDRMKLNPKYNDVLLELNKKFTSLRSEGNSEEHNLHSNDDEESHDAYRSNVSISDAGTEVKTVAGIGPRNEAMNVDHERAHGGERSFTIIPTTKNTLPTSESEEAELSDETAEKSPARKKRLLRRLSTKKYFEGRERDTTYNSESSINEEKDLVIEFKDHSKKARDIGRTNRILDDSNDDFSFSAQGHSAFEIPPFNSVLHSTNVAELKEETNSTRNHPVEAGSELSNQEAPNKKKLDEIPIDAALSSDSSSSSSAASSPFRAIRQKSEHTEAHILADQHQNLRPLQRCKIH